MALIGISILIASLSLLFYRHPPMSWVFLSWRPGAELQRICSSYAGQVVEREMTLLGGESREKGEAPAQEEPEKIKAEIDRKAMPPPPPSFKLYSAPALPDGIPALPEIAPPRASDSVTGDAQSSTPPIFPAKNSIQRASGSHDPRRPKQTPILPSVLGSPASRISPSSRLSLSRKPPAYSSLAPPPTHTAVPTKPSKKVLLTPGHSPLDWAYLSSLPNVNLRGLPQSTPYLKVPPSLLRKHTGRKGKNAWTVLGGKVYNITPYLPYHPGGEHELMKAAGRDGTKLFGEIHPWVNWEGMLESCLVGIAIAEDESQTSAELENLD